MQASRATTVEPAPRRGGGATGEGEGGRGGGLLRLNAREGGGGCRTDGEVCKEGAEGVFRGF